MTVISSTKPRRKKLQRTPLEQNVDLTKRDLQIMQAIVDYGGFLETVQIATLFFQPHLAKKLRWQGLPSATIERVMSEYPASFIDDRIELAKWLLKIRKRSPQVFAGLDPILQSIASSNTTSWLLQAIDQGFSLPSNFVDRPKFASEFVSSSCRDRLRLLYDARYLDRQDQSIKLSEGSDQLLWFITKSSRDLVAKMNDQGTKQVILKSPGSFKDIFIPHRLAVNDFRIAVALAAARNCFELKVNWGEDIMRRKHSKPAEKITYFTDPRNSDSKHEEGSMIPDGYLWLYTGKNWHLFLEIDLGTETLEASSDEKDDWVKKFSRHVAYFEQRYLERYPQAGKSLRYWIITTGKERMQNLADLANEVTGRHSHRFWFSTFDQIAPTYDKFFEETVLTQPISVRADKSGYYPLIW